MKRIGKIFWINYLIILVYDVFIIGFVEKGLALSLILAFTIALHVVVNLALGIIYFFMGKRKASQDFFLIAGIILLIGFSSCWAIA